MLNIGLAVSLPLQASLAYPSSMNAMGSGYPPWDDTSILINAAPNKAMTSQEEFANFHVTEGMHIYFSCVFFLVSIVVGMLVLIKGNFQHFLWHTSLLIQLILHQRGLQRLVTPTLVGWEAQLERCLVPRCQSKGNNLLCFMVIIYKTTNDNFHCRFILIF